MYGGSISGNGTGVSNGMRFHMRGGSITGNSRGVNVNSNDFIVAGKVNITGNKTSDGKTSNIYLPADKTIKVSGALGENAKIGVTMKNEPAEGSYLTIAKGNAYTLTENDLNAFISDSSYGKQLNGNSVIFANGTLHIHALCGASCTHTGTHNQVVWQPLTYNAETQTLYYGGTAISKANDGSYKLPAGNYYLTDNITVDNYITITGNVNLCLNGKTLSTSLRNTTNRNIAFILVDKNTLTLCDCDPDGKGTIKTEETLPFGVNTFQNGNFTMYGGKITGTKSGVYACKQFAMYGGTISGNTEYGVRPDDKATMIIGGDAKIENNRGNKTNVELCGATITIDESLTQESSIGITIANEPTEGKPVQFATGATGELDYTKIFTPDAKDKSYVVSKGEDGSLFLGLHRHSWKYELSKDKTTITAKCTADGCSLENRIGGSVTISASNAVYDRSSKAATVTGTAWKSVPVNDITVTYTGRNGTNYDSAVAPTNVGDYTVSITVGTVTAGVEYSIAAKEVTITSLTAANRSYEKDNLSVALISGTLTGVITGDTVTIDLTNAKGMMTDANAGTGKAVTVTGVALGGDDKGNYRLKEQPIGVTVNITKATAPTLKNITVSQKYSVTTEQSKNIGNGGMPADAGALTYAKGTESKTGSVTVTTWAVDSTGKVTYTLSGGAAGNTVTLPVTIKSTNYADATVNVVITLTAKDIPNVTAKDIVVTYDGNPIPADKITGTADAAGTWEWKAGTAVTDVSDSGPKTVVFKPADSVNYAEVEKTITVTINRATPTGEPKYTEITTGGKTLADAALMLAGGTIPFDEGALEWIDEKGNKLSNETVVEANKSYTWRFTPANTNYTTLTGTIVLYPASTGIVIYTPVNDAIFLSGANQIVAPGSAATFRINKNFGEFRSVAVDGVTLDKSNYRAWSGSTYVKLTPAYMKTLSAGTHTLAVYFTGATATTTFTISAGSSNPATGAGDFAGVGAAVAMAAVSLLGAAAVLRRK